MWCPCDRDRVVVVAVADADADDVVVADAPVVVPTEVADEPICVDMVAAPGGGGADAGVGVGGAAGGGCGIVVWSPCERGKFSKMARTILPIYGFTHFYRER